MRSLMLFPVALCATAAPDPTSAQLTTTYTGTQRDGDKDVPASAEFTIQNGRALMVMKGSRAMRMIFDARAGVLHIISDDDKSFFDITRANAAAGDPSGMMGEMQKQMEKMPKEQRAMAEGMMKGMMGSAATQPPLTYVWSKETREIAGYQCTLVAGMRGDNKVTEYCGSTSNDFKMSDAERATMLDMQGYLRNFGISVQSGDETRAFQWDTSVDGYPVLTRCYRNGTMTLELQLASVSRKPLPDEVFEMPRGYKPMDFGMGKRR
jgi:hypothetical protein